MAETVLIVGGIHGVGKSTLCEYLRMDHGALVLRQRHFLLEIGAELGLEWEEIGPLHFKFIEEVAERIAARITEHKGSLAVIDCHYAIRTSKALRVKGHHVTEPYIADLDPVVVARLAEAFEVRFMMLQSSPECCVERIRKRNPNNQEYESSVPGLRLKSVAELEHFNRMVGSFIPPALGAVVVRNESDKVCMYKEALCFLNMGVA